MVGMARKASISYMSSGLPRWILIIMALAVVLTAFTGGAWADAGADLGVSGMVTVIDNDCSRNRDGVENQFGLDHEVIRSIEMKDDTTLNTTLESEKQLMNTFKTCSKVQICQSDDWGSGPDCDTGGTIDTGAWVAPTKLNITVYQSQSGNGVVLDPG